MSIYVVIIIICDFEWWYMMMKFVQYLKFTTK